VRDLRPFFFSALFASCLGCSTAPAATSSTAYSPSASSTGSVATALEFTPSTSSTGAVSTEELLLEPDERGQLVLAVGGRALIAPRTVLSLERIVSDSRCPADVTCVWAGEIELAFAIDKLRSEAPTQNFTLSTRSPAVELHGQRFELLEAGPAPRSTAKLAPSDYRISLRISSNVPRRKS
jgi:hypothetical protein